MKMLKSKGPKTNPCGTPNKIQDFFPRVIACINFSLFPIE